MIDKLESVKKRLDAIYIINTKLDNTKEETVRLTKEALAEINEVINIIRGKDNG